MIFQMNLGTGWEDISDYVRDNYSLTEAACSPDYKYAKNTLDFGLTYNEDLFSRLHSILDYVYVRVYEDDGITPVFIGRFVPCVGLVYNGILDIQQITISVEDYSSMLDVTMEEFVIEDMKILDPSDTAHSIIHVLFTHLGLSHSLIDSSVSIMDTVGAAVADDDTNALDFVSTLLYEYGWVPNWSAAGLFHPIRWIQEEDAETTFTFNDDNIIGQIEESPKDLDKEGAKVYWYGLAERADTRVYTEDLKWDEDGDFEGYPILRETFYPDEANVIDETTGTYQVVEQEYTETGIRYGANKYIEAGYAQDFALEHADFTRILVTKNHTIGDRYDAGLTRDITVFGNKKAQIRYWNPMITSRQLYYMHIDADITYTKSRNTTKVEYVANTKKIDEYDSSFLFSATYADRLAKAMAMAMRLGRYTYKIVSEEKVAEGSYVGIVVSNGIVATGLVLERVLDGLTGLYSYTIRSYDTNYMPVAARTTRLSSLSADDAIGMISAINKSPVFSIEGNKEFSYYVGESTPVNASLVLSATPSDPNYEVTSYQWYYRTEAGVDTEIVGATSSQLTINYNESWFYPNVTVICDINGKYSFTAVVKNTYNASYLGDYSSDPDYAMPGDWYFYTGATGGERTQYTMYLWDGAEWIEDTYPSHNVMVYDLISSVSSLTLYSGGVFSPPSVTLNSKRKVGQSAYYAYDGRFTVEEARLDSTYSGVYASTVDESSYIFPPSGTISSLRFRLYEAGGFTELLDEYILPVTMSTSTIESMAPRYWGSLTSAPTDLSVHINDYYLDSNTVASGGGKIRYYTGITWAEMPTNHQYYATALKMVMTDLMIWATAQGETVAAANAVFGSIAAASAFITELASQVAFVQNLFANQIEVPDGGRIRYYNGEGVQKRCVELSEDRIDWIDTPDTTPASSELLRGRIGRLGVSAPILMDGDFSAPIESSWSPRSAKLNTGNATHLTASARSNRDVWIAYAVSGVWYYRVKTGSTFSAQTALGIGTGGHVCLHEESSGSFYAYYTKADGIYRSLRSGSSWVNEELILLGTKIRYLRVVEHNGVVRLGYEHNQNSVKEIIHNGSAWESGETFITSASGDISCSFVVGPDGFLRVAYSSNNSIYERIHNGTSWGAQSSSIAEGSFPSYVPALRELKLAFITGGVGLQSLDYVGGSWENLLLVSDEVYSDVPFSSLDLADGSFFVVYLYFQSNIVYSTLQRYAQLGAGIIESGNNANGYYIKWSDGTLECWGADSLAISSISNENIGTYGWSYYYGTKANTFSAEFLPGTTPVVNINGNSTGSNAMIAGSAYNITNTGFSLIAYYAASVGLARYGYRAIGRWRA